MWIPPEDFDLMLIHWPNRKHIAFFGAVCDADGRLVESRIEKFCSEAFLSSFIQLPFHGKEYKEAIIVCQAHNACKNKCFDVSQNERFMGDKEKTTFSTYCGGWQYMQAYDYVPDLFNGFYPILLQHKHKS